ncbi:MAG TPA: XTP/dITP diphosphatase [Clostridia bacterium]|nr:XTP/dITP diphosphatase [Clostridia bacterium]
MDNDLKNSKTEPIRIIVATKNKGKLEEFAQLLSRFPCEVISMSDAGFTEDIEENGATFEENAMIKAKSVWKVTGGVVLADDSGLEVDILDGAPGVYSARYAGEGATDADRNRKLLRALDGVPGDKRSARFVCAIAAIFPGGSSLIVRDTCEGYIAFEPAGDNGFGYDPLFFVPEYGQTVAQMDSELKNGISHRGKAMRRLAEKFGQHWMESMDISRQ